MRYTSNNSMKLGTRSSRPLIAIVFTSYVSSLIDISDSNDVALNHSIARLSSGGIVTGIACGSEIYRTSSQRVMLRARDASLCPTGTELNAPRTISDPYAPAFNPRTVTPATNGLSSMPNSGRTKNAQNNWTMADVPRKTSTYIQNISRSNRLRIIARAVPTTNATGIAIKPTTNVAVAVVRPPRQNTSKMSERSTTTGRWKTRHSGPFGPECLVRLDQRIYSHGASGQRSLARTSGSGICTSVYP